MIISNIINLISWNYRLKKIKFKAVLNKKEFYIIDIFIKLNIIKNIIKNDLKKNEYFIYLNYYDEKPIFYNIKNMYKPSSLRFISLKEIIKLNRKKNTLFYVSTTKGIISNYQAEKSKCGGVLIMLIIV